MKENPMVRPDLRLVLLGILLPVVLAFQTSCDNGCPSCSRGEPGGTVNGSASSGQPSSTAKPTPVEPRPLLEQQVEIFDFKFEPPTLAVRPGTRVTWVNKDDEPHTATSSEKPKRFDSGPLDTAQAYSFVFGEAGSFSYFCKLHPHMTGVIVVK
jgi:plastocyanin